MDMVVIAILVFRGGVVVEVVLSKVVSTKAHQHR
jgi:hypothetical protein